MGLAASQVRMLSLTSRKASIERDILQSSNRKIALSREMNNLANEYYDALSAEKLMYLSDTGEYTNLSYQYLMGKPGGIEDIDVKSDNSMLLIDTLTGEVVLSHDMASKIGFDQSQLASSSQNIYVAIARLCGDSNITIPDDSAGTTYIISPKLVKDICAGKYDTFDVNDLTDAIQNNDYCLCPLDDSVRPVKVTPFCPAGEIESQWIKNFKDLINDVKFYFTIVTACAKFGMTSDYDQNLKDSDYIDKNIQNGVFQLMGFDTKLFSLESAKDTDYYLLTSEFSKMNDPAQQAIITAWYETEKAEINSKETYLDTQIENLSIELNSIKTEIESVKTLIDDAVKQTFDWGKG